jgi:hypothetical protein
MLKLPKRENETWLEALTNQAEKYGLVEEVLEDYRAYKNSGDTDQQAAWCAAYDWDILNYEPEDGKYDIIHKKE